MLRSKSRPPVEVARKTGAAVIYLGEQPGTGLPWIQSNNGAIARVASVELIDRGYRNFGFAGLRGTHWSDQRRLAFTRILGEAGFGCSVCERGGRTNTATSWTNQVEALSRWLVELPKPVGVMACCDVMRLD